MPNDVTSSFFLFARYEPRIIARIAIFIGVIGLCVLDSGCQDNSRWGLAISPDGKRIARIHTVEPGPMGIGVFGTTVDVNWTEGSQQPVIVFEVGNGPSEPNGLAVGLRWLDSAHLQIIYKHGQTIDFQAVKCCGIEISASEEVQGGSPLSFDRSSF